MHLRNGPHGYGLVSKLLHWLTVLLLVVQVPLGFALDWDDDAGDREDLSGKDREDRREELQDLREDRAEEADEQRLVPVHASLGLAILAVGLLRVTWRATTPLPPWAEQMTARDKKLATWTERALLTALVLMPATGLVLLRSGDDDLLPLHLASHALLYAALLAHLGLVLRRRTLRRML